MVDTQEKTQIQNKLETNILGTFLDIELVEQIGTRETKITEMKDEIEITFEVPELIRNTDNAVTRTYRIMRNHDGVVDILDVESYNETTYLLTFKTDKFSTCALVYRDTAKNQPAEPGATPDKGDIPSIPTEEAGANHTSDQSKTSALSDTVSKEEQEKDALSLNAKWKVSQTGKKVNIAWGKIAGADGYDVYVQYCGKKFTKKSVTAIKKWRDNKGYRKENQRKAIKPEEELQNLYPCL